MSPAAAHITLYITTQQDKEKMCENKKTTKIKSKYLKQSWKVKISVVCLLQPHLSRFRTLTTPSHNIRAHTHSLTVITGVRLCAVIRFVNGAWLTVWAVTVRTQTNTNDP